MKLKNFQKRVNGRLMLKAVLVQLSLLFFMGNVSAQVLNPLASEQLVNTDIGAYQYRSEIAADESGGYVAVWHVGSYGALLARKYNSSHVPVTGEITINSTDCKEINIEYWKDGKYIITFWRGGDLFYRILNADNSVSGAYMIQADAQEDHYDLDIKGDSVAFVYVKVPASSAVAKNVYMRVRNLQTNSWVSAEAQVSPQGLYTGVRYPRVVFHPTGRLTIIYNGRYQWGTVSSDSDQRLLKRTYDASFAAEGGEVIVLTGDHEDFVYTGADAEGNANSEVIIAMNHGRISNLRRYVRMWIVNEAGSYLVNEDVLLDHPSTTALYSGPSCQIYDDGDFVIGMGLRFNSTDWSESMVLYGDNYNDQNSGWLTTNTFHPNGQTDTDVAKLPNNNFVVSWTGQGSTDSQGTYLRAYNSVGFPGVGTDASGNVVVDETGSTQVVNFSLNTQPTANVVVNLSSSDVGEGTLSASQLTFTTTDWNVPQPVTVTGIDDAIDDGNINFTINVNYTGSSDATYLALPASTIPVVNLDDEATMASLSNETVCKSDGLTITNYTVTNLGSAITGLTGSSSNQGVVEDGDISITPVNSTTWNISIANLGDNVAGTTTISIVATDGTFNYTETFDLTTTAPTINGGSDVDVCNGSQTTLSGSGGVSYTWTGGVIDGTPFTPTATTTYTVTGTDGSGCENTDQVVVTVNALPTIDAGSNVSVCSGNQVTLTATGGVSYTWTGGVTNGVAFTPAATSTYTVTGTDANSCSSTDAVVVTVNSIPATPATISGNTTVCSGSSNTYSVVAIPNATSYTWTIPGGWTGTSSTASINVVAGASGGNITVTANNVCGSSSAQTLSVTSGDAVAPVADVATLSDVTAQCQVTSLTAPTATDNCAGSISGTHNATLPITAQGTTVVTWTYADGNGNSSTQTQNVVINDNTAPVADVATLSDVTAQCQVTSLTAPTATDNCTGAITGTHNTTLPITAQGTTVVTWTYADGNGNSSTQTQNVVINDNTAPVADIATLSDVTAQCQVTSLTAPTATDNCTGAITGTHNATLPITTQGTTVVTWTYADGNGNSATQTQNVVITDNTAPVADAASLSNVTAQCQVTSLTAPTATDNCVGPITGTHNATLPITAQGTTVVTWTYSDGNGNSSTQTQNVVITDNTAPVADVASLSNITAQCQVTSLTAPTATDNCAGSVTGAHNATLPITAQGTTIVTWTYADGNGNTTTQTQNVIITDNVAPVANAASLSDITTQCQVTSLTAPTATDNCAGSVTGTHNVTLPITAQGTTVVTWTYDDGNGNTTTQTQNVVITDNIAPAADAVFLSNVTAQCQVTSLTAPTATDNCAGAITGTHNATLPITTQGTTVVTWTYNDGNGNTTTQTQNVVITDNAAPIANVASLSDVTAECEVTSLTAPTAMDNCAGSLSGTHDATLPITAQGTTVVTWTYDDGNGNTTTQTQNVVIDDVTDPVADVATLSDVTAECEVTSLTAPTATDNCAGSLTGTHNATLPITAQGTTVVTWTYNDGNGNTITQTQNVVIDDNTAPVADVTNLIDVTADCEVTSLTAPTAADNCAGSVTGTHNATLPITTQGTTVVTWTYDDGNGNTSTQTQNVVIDDVTAPVADLATLSDVTNECSISSLTAPTATDNCGGTIAGTPNVTFPITTQGSFTITWTYDDGNGNTSTQTQSITIDDVSNPVADNAILGDITSECEVTSLTAPTATDNCAGAITGTHDATLPITTQGTTVVTWTYDDGNGNTSTQTQNVVIDDVTDPVADAATLSDVTVQCEVTSLTPPTATDNCAGSITGTHNATLPITSQGTTVVTWTYDDGNGNMITQTQNVIINDDTAPTGDVATLADVTAECEVTSLTEPTATDNCGGTVTVAHNATLPITTQGTTVVTWTYTDENGNSSTQDQNIVIADQTAPVADASSLTDITSECEVTSLTAPTAIDNCAGAITGTHDATLPITASGTTVVTWTYDDGNGNTSTQTQNVVITPVDVTTTTELITDDQYQITANATGYTYQWVDCNNGNAAISGATGISFVPESNGSYAVIIDNGTCTNTSECVVIDDLGIENHFSAGVRMYPNPTAGKVFIEVGKVYGQIEVRVYNTLGQRLSSDVFNSVQQMEIELGSVPGVYLIELENEEGHIMQKRIVKK